MSNVSIGFATFFLRPGYRLSQIVRQDRIKTLGSRSENRVDMTSKLYWELDKSPVASANGYYVGPAGTGNQRPTQIVFDPVRKSLFVRVVHTPRADASGSLLEDREPMILDLLRQGMGDEEYLGATAYPAAPIQVEPSSDASDEEDEEDDDDRETSLVKVSLWAYCDGGNLETFVTRWIATQGTLMPASIIASMIRQLSALLWNVYQKGDIAHMGGMGDPRHTLVYYRKDVDEVGFVRRGLGGAILSRDLGADPQEHARYIRDDAQGILTLAKHLMYVLKDGKRDSTADVKAAILGSGPLVALFEGLERLASGAPDVQQVEIDLADVMRLAVEVQQQAADPSTAEVRRIYESDISDLELRKVLTFDDKKKAEECHPRFGAWQLIYTDE